jgi:uncharacterized protein
VTLEFSKAIWLNEPKMFELSSQSVSITTEANTDFWQRSYYGFRHDNAPAFLLSSEHNISFTTKASFTYQARFDQCGIIIYHDSENWFKASIEYENKDLSRLGSVVTNHGYSDWATTDITTPQSMWYRLSRRGPDFLVESSSDGVDFKQMRIFHLHILGDTTVEMAKGNPSVSVQQPIHFGLYACSPLESSFQARFDNFTLEGSIWKAHETQEGKL